MSGAVRSISLRIASWSLIANGFFFLAQQQMTLQHPAMLPQLTVALRG